jgi:hypothetical protein
MMRRGQRITGLRGSLIALGILIGWTAVGLAQPREHIGDWRTQYQELARTADPRADKAHSIFKRLLQVAGTRPDVVPQLFIIASDPWDIMLPVTLSDGWIILSKGALDICYRDPARGDDRLAFVLAHELAHLLNDDIWHLRFLQALAALQQGRAPAPDSPAFAVRRSASDTEAVLARELRADERGIMYATMAGFNPRAIVTEDQGVNFFADWLRALAPRRLEGISVDRLRPTPQERAETLRTLYDGWRTTRLCFRSDSGSMTRETTHEPCRRLRTSGCCSPAARYPITWRRVTTSWPYRRTRAC